VVVIGAQGRMGRFSCELLERTPGFEVAARLGPRDDLERALQDSDAELGLDFTVAGLGAEHGQRLLAAGLRPVIGTSGVDAADTRRLDDQARERGLGGLVVPNFSLGMVWMQRLACELVRSFPAVEIVELHHERKRDAPSGTARDTARRLREARGTPAEVPIHSLRLPGAYAHQELSFGAPGERLTLRHDMLGPEAFGPGILAALTHAARCEGVGHGLELALPG